MSMWREFFEWTAWQMMVRLRCVLCKSTVNSVDQRLLERRDVESIEAAPEEQP